MSFRRIPLTNAYNVRELGGYPTKHEQVTKEKAFIRSDEVANLSEEEIAYLKEYGVRAVIDLRSSEEAAFAKNPFANMDGLTYRNIPLLKMDKNTIGSFADMKELFVTYKGGLLTKMYIEILDNSKVKLKEIFEFIAGQTGCVLFHCAAGKDRTGVLAMLLLGLAEVGRADIIADYMVTEVYNEENPNEVMASLPIDLPKELLASHPSYIAATYDYIIENYATIEDYLLSADLKKETIKKVKEMLLISHT